METRRPHWPAAEEAWKTPVATHHRSKRLLAGLILAVLPSLQELRELLRMADRDAVDALVVHLRVDPGQGGGAALLRTSSYSFVTHTYIYIYIYIYSCY